SRWTSWMMVPPTARGSSEVTTALEVSRRVRSSASWAITSRSSRLSDRARPPISSLRPLSAGASARAGLSGVGSAAWRVAGERVGRARQLIQHRLQDALAVGRRDEAALCVDDTDEQVLALLRLRPHDGLQRFAQLVEPEAHGEDATQVTGMVPHGLGHPC